MESCRSVVKDCLLPMTLLFLLFGIHFYYLNRYGINVPFSDDYNEILKNMNMILDSGSLSESARHLLHGNGYSKPITLRLISLAHLSLIHQINFKYLVFTGNFFLLLTCFVLALSAAPVNKYLIVTIGCFVFQPQYWEAIYQATLSNSVFPCLFFSLASLYCIAQERTWHYVLSLVCAVLAQISFGNGFMVYPLLLMVSVFKKNVQRCIVTGTTMVLTTYLYMLGSTVSYTEEKPVELWTKLKLWAVWLCEFLGSSIGYALSSGYGRDTVGKTASIVIGLLVVFFYLFVIKKKYYSMNPVLFSFLTFFILTALLATKLRFSVEVPGASRYQIQSALCVLMVVMIFIDMYSSYMHKSVVMMLVIVFPLLFLIASYKTNTSTVSGHKARLASGMWAWSDHGTGLTIWGGEEAAGRLLMQSSARNIYRIPSKEFLMTEAWKQ